MGNITSMSYVAKHLDPTTPFSKMLARLQAKEAASQNSMSASTGTAVPAPLVQTTTEGDLSVNRKKRRGKASLIIDSTNPTNTGTGGSGLNV